LLEAYPSGAPISFKDAIEDIKTIDP